MIMHLLLTLNLLFAGSLAQASSAAKVTANMASIPWREDSLKVTVQSILPQVDQLNIMLNGYDHIPPFLNHPKITAFRSQDFQDYGAKAKFFWASKASGYYFTIDDDLIYPPNYVEYMIKKIEKYQRRVVVGVHGSIFKSNFHDYYKDRHYFSYVAPLKSDVFVTMLGTGTLAFHTDTIKIALNDLPYNNMVDLWFAIAAKTRKIPLVCVSRGKEFIKAQPTAFHHSIASSSKENCTEHTEIAKKHLPWSYVVTVQDMHRWFTNEEHPIKKP